MSTATLQAMAGDIVDAFVDAGIADMGTYTAPGGSAITCRVIVDRAKAPFGGYGTVIGNTDKVTLLLAEIAQPVRDARIVSDGLTLKLVKEIAQNGSTSTWEVAVL